MPTHAVYHPGKLFTNIWHPLLCPGTLSCSDHPPLPTPLPSISLLLLTHHPPTSSPLPSEECHPISAAALIFPPTLSRNPSNPTNPLPLFLTRPLLFTPLLFPNTSSDARDHCANERTLLSYLRLAIYLAVVAVAILINFHLKHQPTPLERRISFPLGIIFWTLALATLISGYANYMNTVAKYARRQAIVQTGVKTQVVLSVVSAAIVAACAVFLGAEAQVRGRD